MIMAMRFHIVTLFPESLQGYLESSMIKRATGRKLFSVEVIDPRTFTQDKHRKADDKPYGGGPGMVMKALPIVRAVEKINKKKGKKKIIILSPRGKQFTQAIARSFAGAGDLILIAGHYEGIDARVKKILRATEISIGPYTLTGGELPALTVLDAVARYIPGVLGKKESLEEHRVAGKDVYTRPESIEYKGKKYRVPKVLLSGNHKKITAFRQK